MEVEKNVKLFNTDKGLPVYKIVYSNDWIKGFKSDPRMIAALKEKFGVLVVMFIKENYDRQPTVYIPDNLSRHDPWLVQVMEEYVRLETQFNSELEFTEGFSYRIIETDSEFYMVDTNDYGEFVVLQDQMVRAPSL